jgi:hypothetical protein
MKIGKHPPCLFEREIYEKKTTNKFESFSFLK